MPKVAAFLVPGFEVCGLCPAVRRAEQAALVMLGPPTSRAAAQDHNRRKPAPVISESSKEHLPSPGQLPEINKDALPHKDLRKLLRHVIYHCAVGRAVPDPRVEA